MSKEITFTDGKIFSPLVRFTLPILFALFLQAMYGAVDLAVIGRFCETSEVSAVSTGSQIMQTVTFIIASLAMGATVLLGQKLGQGRREEAGDVVGSAICLFSVIAVAVTVIMEFVAPLFASAMNAPESAFDSTVMYVRVCSGGMVFIVAYNIFGSIFRGIGDSATPLLAVGISCILNIAGDLLFVAVFDMKSAGAAFATVLSQGISVFLCLLIVRKRGLPFDFSRRNIAFKGSVIKQIIKIGIPMSVQDLLVSISFLAILAIVNALGEVASAAIGVAEKVCAFIMLIPSSFMQSLSAFVAQNIGAGKQSRAVKAMLMGMVTSFVIALPVAYISFFHGDIPASLFAHGKVEVIEAAADYLKAYAIDTMLVSFLFCFGGFFSGCGKTSFILGESLAGAFGVRIPVSFIMSKRTPVSLFSVGLATPCSTVLQIILCSVYFAFLVKKDKKSPR